MPTTNLTPAFIKGVGAPTKGQILYFDENLPGFGLRVTPGSKSFIAEGRVKGRKRRVTIGSANVLNLPEAKKLAKVRLAEMIRGLDANAKKAEDRAKTLTLGEAVEAFLSGRNVKPKTKYDYLKTMQLNFSDWWNKPLADLTHAMLLARFAKIRERTEAGSALAMRTFRTIWNATRADLVDAKGDQILREWPADRIKAKKMMPAPRRKQGHVKDVPAFFEALGDAHGPEYTDFSAFMELALRTGARRGELSGLRWQDVDERNRTITFRETKNGKDHTLPTTTQIDAVLQRLRERHTVGKYIWGSSPLGDPRKSLRRFRTAYGEAISPHDCRRSFTGLAQAVGVPFLVLKRLLNHSFTDVTGGYYVDGSIENLRGAMDAISQEIDRLRTTG